MIAITTLDAQRFRARVDSTSGDEECWRFMRAYGKGYFTTYALIRLENGRVYAHHVAYVLAYGVIPVGMEVCHKCDNPACCNPAHLFLGTHQENMQDRSNKGRQFLQRKDYRTQPFTNEVVPETHKRGTRNGNAKLTPELVTTMRQEYASGNVSQHDLAKKHHIHQSLVSRIIRRLAWQHIP